MNGIASPTKSGVAMTTRTYSRKIFTDDSKTFTFSMKLSGN